MTPEDEAPAPRPHSSSSSDRASDVRAIATSRDAADREPPVREIRSLATSRAACVRGRLRRFGEPRRRIER